MTDKPMPERVYISYRGFDVMGYAAAFDSHVKMKDGTDFTPHEYIRADLAQGDANEPLEVDQWRWVKVFDYSDWRPALVNRCDKQLRTFFVDAVGHIQVETVSAIGPVIQPPEKV